MSLLSTLSFYTTHQAIKTLSLIICTIHNLNNVPMHGYQIFIVHTMIFFLWRAVLFFKLIFGFSQMKVNKKKFQIFMKIYTLCKGLAEMCHFLWDLARLLSRFSVFIFCEMLDRKSAEFYIKYTQSILSRIEETFSLCVNWLLSEKCLVLFDSRFENIRKPHQLYPGFSKWNS